MDGVETLLFDCLNVEGILHCVGDHVQGEGWRRVRHFQRLEEFVDHVEKEGVEKDGASFSTGDGRSHSSLR